ncbi:pseudouridine synthase family protein [Wolffia australiana]
MVFYLPAAGPSPSSSLRFFHGEERRNFPKFFCSSPSPQRAKKEESRANNAGVRLEEIVDKETARARLDSWISSRINGVSRARVQASIRSGLVSVNGCTIDKVSHTIKFGDRVSCTVSELQPLRAEPEDIPLDIVYEDAHILVVNKPAHMVVHPAPGNPNGTLVNAILHHCQLPSMAFQEKTSGSDEDDDDEGSDGDLSEFSCFDSISRSTEAAVRPGIVHRLDKGTSGLLVVAKDEHSHAHLAEQFKDRRIRRVYISLTSGVPSSTSGRVEVPIARDPTNRIRMTAVSGLKKNARGARFAASRYKVMGVLAGAGAALVEWRLETGRTHQIRVHAKYMGIPLLGDELYGGTKSHALSLLRAKNPPFCHFRIGQVVSKLQRPCLHALSIGFKHPHTGEEADFTCPPPPDFSELLGLLQSLDKAL